MASVKEMPLDELIAMALVEEKRDQEGRRHTSWAAIPELHTRGSREVFDRATALIDSSIPLERALGLDILSQLGSPKRPFLGETIPIVEHILAREEDSSVIQSAAVAFGHLRDRRGRPHLLALASHPTAEVRQAVAWALPWCAHLDDDGNLDDAEAVATLISLTEDPDNDVRDWATFALGEFFTTDTPQIRATLAARLDDPHDDTREEAICGLARRHDERALVPLSDLLHNFPGMGAIEAAADMGDPRLVDPLLAAEKYYEHRLEMIRDAIKKCRGEPEPDVD